MKNRCLFIAAFVAFTVNINASVRFVGNNCDPDIVAYMQGAITKQLASISPRYNIEFSFVQEGDKVIVNYSDDKNGINGKEQTADIWSDVDKMINNLANGVKEQIERDQTQRQQKAQESVTPVQKPASKTQQTTRQTPQHTAEEMQFLKYAPTKVASTNPTEQVPEQEQKPAVEKNTQPSINQDSIRLARQREELEQKERELAEAERKLQERERALEEARAHAEAERQAKEQTAIARANQVGSLLGNGGYGNGSGQKGNPVGHGSVGAASWSLVGRECKSMVQPSNNFRQEGKVVVSIQVDAAGNVVSASETTGTTVSDYSTIQIALKAARETKFSASSSKVQIGTITYIFKFK